VNILGINGELMIDVMLECTTYFEETSTMEDSVDGANGNGGGGGWHASASTMDGCDGRGGVDGWIVGAPIEYACNNKYGGGGW
jgi:hypothetical protein